MKARIYLPYYIVETGRGKRFYGETHLSLRALWTRILVLATPRDLGFIKMPLGGTRLEPLAKPDEYGRKITEALERASEVSRTKPTFKIGGVRGLLKAMVTGFRSKVSVKSGPELEARLILYYASRALGLEPGDRVRVYPETLWLPVEVLVGGDGGVEAYISSKGVEERFTLLEKFASMDAGVRESIIAAIESWKPL
ncbi:MAG: hypothetical protein F7C38_03525 [Desulfurococcales archaeon]|nr:hypothetical protein [Desulfurococcales archaeon]